MREVQSGVHEPSALHLQPCARQRWRLQVSRAYGVALPLLLLLPVADLGVLCWYLLSPCCIDTLLYILLGVSPVIQDSI